MIQVTKAFVWQLFARVGEEAFAQGLFPTDDEKVSRSKNTLGTMLVAGNLVLLGSTLITPVALLPWILTGRGPGQRLLVYSVGGTRLGKRLVARASACGLVPQAPKQ